MFHGYSCSVAKYQRETRIELMLVEIETKGCADSIADIREQVTSYKLISDEKNCC